MKLHDKLVIEGITYIASKPEVEGRCLGCAFYNDETHTWDSHCKDVVLCQPSPKMKEAMSEGDYEDVILVEKKVPTVRENLINSINKLIANINSKFTSPVIKSTIEDNISIEELTRTYNLLYDLNEPTME